MSDRIGVMDRGRVVQVGTPTVTLSDPTASEPTFTAPFVSAACALLVARADARAWPVTSPVLRELLVASCRPHSRAGVEGSGAGVLDVAAGLRALDQRIDELTEAIQQYPAPGLDDLIEFGPSSQPIDPAREWGTMTRGRAL